MAKDFAFMFYPGDYLRDTQCLSEKAQVAYDRIMCEHMRNICITQQQLNFFTKKLSPDEVEELMMVLEKVEGGFQIEWVVISILKRMSYSDSRSKNRLGKSKQDMKNTSQSYDSHMEDEIEYIVKQLRELSKVTIQEEQKTTFAMIVLKMMEVFKKHNPDYFFHQESDYSACLNIAYHIASMKKWSKDSVLNGKLQDCVSSWETIVLFIKKDNWASTRSLTDLSTIKEWQRLVQKMSKPTTNDKPSPGSPSENPDYGKL